MRRRAGSTVLATALLAAATLAGCGGSEPSEPAPTTTVAPAPDVGTLTAAQGRDASGVVTLCGDAARVAAVRDAIARFNRARPRLQASTIAFPAARGRPVRELAARSRAASKECDVYALALGAVARAATRAWLLNLQPYAEERGQAGPFAAIRVGPDAYGVRLRTAGPPTALVAAAATRNPGGALALLDVLSGGRVTAEPTG